MIDIDDNRFQTLINRAFDKLPKNHRDAIKNVAILFADEADATQNQLVGLRHDQILLGLYEGVPLSQRQGVVRLLPDKITLFKRPLTSLVSNEIELQQEIYHTLWHEIAHYYGLNHQQIHALE